MTRTQLLSALRDTICICFRDVLVGETFEFVNDPARCTKVSTQCYTYETAGTKLEAKVGSINVPVYVVRG